MGELTWRQRLLRKLYNVVHLLFDPQSYAKDEERRARNEIEARLGFFLLNDINKVPEHETENSNNLTNEERIKYFGKAHLQLADITWDKLENILMPASVKGAVFRVNDALQGSHINERFSKVNIKGGANEATDTKATYIPRTVTVYENEERARVAAKLLRILTEQSGATIRAEPIIMGTVKPKWVVSDNMDLQTHNALRLIFTHFSHKRTPEEQKAAQQKAQLEVNARLPDGEKWEALEGVGTFLTLAGRPGVKMYKTLPNGKDDPEDRKIIDRIPPQKLPVYVRGVPHNTVIAPDGRRYMEPGNTKAIIGHLLLGPNGYAFLTTGDVRAFGDVLREEAEFLTLPKRKSTVFGKGESALEAFHSIPTKFQTVIAGVVSVVGVGSAMLVCVGSYKACQKVAKMLSKGKWEFDPIKKTFKPYVVKTAGDPTKPEFTKEWTFRETGEAIGVKPDELLAYIEPLKDQSLATALGDVQIMPIEDLKHSIKWVDSLEDNIGQEFCKFMHKNNLWPHVKDFTQHGKHKIPSDRLPDDYYGARDRLGKAYAKWIEKLRNHQERSSPNYSPTSAITLPANEVMEPPSEELAKRLNEFVEAVQKHYALPGDTANTIIDVTREALRKGMGGFLAERPFMVNIPGAPL